MLATTRHSFTLSALAAFTTLALLPTGDVSAQSVLEARTTDGEEATMRLSDERIRAVISGQYSSTTVRQTYINETPTVLEGRYIITAGEGARVQGFAYWNGETKIVGDVYEKEVAREVYEEVTGLGRDPGLLERIGEGSFAFRVFPIAVGEKKPIELSLGKWLPRSEGVVEYRMPISSSKATIEVAIRDDRGVDGISSSTHKITKTVGKDGETLVRASSAKAGADEFVLRYRPKAAPWQLKSYLHKDKGHDGYLALTLATPKGVAQAKVTSKDVTLVLDRSGSMRGEPIKNARLAAIEVVSKLAKGDKINVVLFDDGVESLYKLPKAISEDVRKEVIAYIETVEDSGGTDIAGALRYALAAQTRDAFPNIIMFLTDGQSSTQDAIAAAKSDTGDSRIFTIGVGSGVEKALLSRIAKEKRGRFTYIESPAAIGSRVKKLYAQIESPVMVDVELVVDGVTLTRRYPRSMPDLYKGDELRVSARVRGGGVAKVLVRGTIAGKAVAFRTSVSIAAASAPWVGRLWAESRTDDLLEEIALQGETDELKNEVIKLATAYNFASPYTSFLAIPESELTESTKATLADARARKAKILAAHRDAAALSRSAMPPGDPILKVKAPKNALQVTAYFPFGLEKDLRYDSSSEHWKLRFLVPKSVVDGEYQVKIVIAHANGRVEMASIPYTIDSSGPEITIETEAKDGFALIRVTSTEALRTATVLTDSGVRVDLKLSADRMSLEGRIDLAAGSHALKVVVSDRARNESEESVDVVIASSSAVVELQR